MTDTTEPDFQEVEDLPEERDGATDVLDTEEPEGEEEEDLDAEDSDEDEEDTEPELVEVEIDGKTYKVAPELRDGYMLRADYTRKTQEVAEQRKALEARITEAQEASEAEQKAFSNIAAIDAALGHFEQVDWDALERQNPAEANRLFRNFTLLQQQRGQAERELQEARQQRESQTQRHYAEQFEKSMTELKQAIPDWGETKAVALKQFASETFGFTDEEFRIALHDPRQVKLVNLAYAAANAKPRKPTAPKPKPASKVKGGSAPRKGLDDRLSAEDWVKRRNAQLNR